MVRIFLIPDPIPTSMSIVPHRDPRKKGWCYPIGESQGMKAEGKKVNRVSIIEPEGAYGKCFLLA